MVQIGQVHVVPDDEHWTVTVEGGGPRIRYRSREEAMDGARAIASANNSRMIIHTESGDMEPHRPCDSPNGNTRT